MLADDALAQADHLHVVVQRDPEAAARASRALLAELPPNAHAAVRCVATWALGRALFESGMVDASLVQLRAAAASARRRGDERTLARVQGTMAWVLVEAGRSRAALTALRRAEPATPPEDLGRLLTQRVLVHAHRGELADAVAVAARALALLRVHEDELGEVRLLVNRSMVWLNAGQPRAAERDLEAARPIAVRLGQDLIVAGIDHNLAVAAGRRGRLPQSLRRFEAAAVRYQELGSPGRVVAILEVDRAEVLLHAGLYREAAESAARAADLAAQSGHLVSAGESLLLRARSLAEVGAPEAGEAARAAATAFGRSGRRSWVLLARAVQWEIDSTGAPSGRVVARGRALARALAEAGWLTESRRLSSEVALRALELGTPEARIAELADAPARRRAGPAWLRARWWYVEAVRRRRRGEPRRALAAIEAGLRAIDEHRRAFGSLELRVGASNLGVPLAALALDIVSPDGDPDVVLWWAERWRTSALASRPAARRPGAALATARAALRTRQAALAQVAPHEDGYRRAAVALARAEADVRRLARGSEDAGPAEVATRELDGLSAALGDAVLVAYHQQGDRVAAVVVRDGRSELVDVAPHHAVEAEADHLLGAVHRGLVDERAAGRATEAAAVAQEVFLRGIDVGDGGRPVVVVPHGPLHGVPWGVLPRLAASPVTVAPSTGTWLRLRQEPAPALGRALLVAGPQLDGARREVRTLGRMLTDAQVLPADAGVADVIDELERADLVHIAAHGTFRSDDPMLSSLQLADGNLTVYDLEHLRRVPSTVVLSACSAGAVATPGGSEVMGTVAVLLDRGVVDVVAPVTVFPDRLATAVMRTVYARLLAGDDVASALAAARRSARTDHDRVAAGVLTCFGR